MATTATYVFVGGSESMCGGTAMKSFGQQIDLTEKDAATAMRGGCALLPAEQFNAIGFTADELKKYPTAGFQLNAPQSFLEKRQSAWNAFGKIYASLEQPRSEIVETPVVPSPQDQAPPTAELPREVREHEEQEHHD